MQVCVGSSVLGGLWGHHFSQFPPRWPGKGLPWRGVCGSVSNELAAIGGNHNTAASLLFLCFHCSSSSLSSGLQKIGKLCPRGKWTSVSRASGVTYEAEGSSLPHVCPTLLVTTATPAEAKEGRWFGINRLVKEKKGLCFLL